MAVVATMAVVCGWDAVGADCTDATLADALARGATEVEVRGQVDEYTPSFVSQPVAVVARAGAVLHPPAGTYAAITVLPGGDGSTFDGLVVDGSTKSGDDGGVFDVSATGVVVRSLYTSALNSSLPVVSVHDGGELQLIDPILTGQNYGTAPIMVDQATLDVQGGTFAMESFYVQSISANASVVSVTGVTLGSYAGGFALLSLTSSQTTLTDVSVYGSVPAVTAVGGELTIDGGLWAVQSSPLPMIQAVDLTSLLVDGASLQADGGVALSVQRAALVTLRNATFPAGSPAVALDSVPLASVEGSWFCAAYASPALTTVGSCDAGCTVSRSVFQGGFAPVGAAAIKVDGGELVLDHDTFSGDVATYGYDVLVGPTGSLAVTHTLFAHVHASALMSAPDPEVFEYNAFAGNTPVGTFEYDPSLSKVVDVKFRDLRSPCGSSVVLDPGSDGWVLDNDVGAEETCHTTDAPGDGVDEDCDGWESCPADLDGDGFAGDDYGDVGSGDPTVQPTLVACPVVDFGDCDDDASDAFPGAVDPWYDHRDQDCAGNDDQDRDGDGVPKAKDCDDRDPDTAFCRFGLAGGSCSTAGPSGALAWALAALVSVGSRRRSHRALRARLTSRPHQGGDVRQKRG